MARLLHGQMALAGDAAISFPAHCPLACPAGQVFDREVQMMMIRTIAILVASSVVTLPAPVRAGDADATYSDMRETLGSVPTMFSVFPEAGIEGAWNEFKSLQLNPKSALDGKTKELLGLAVAAQIPCHYCIYFHTAAAKLNGATDDEIRETVAMAAIVRHWSTVLNGMQVDETTFRKETDELLARAAKAAAVQ